MYNIKKQHLSFGNMGKRALPTLCYLHVTQLKIGRHVTVNKSPHGLSKWVRNLSACSFFFLDHIDSFLMCFFSMHRCCHVWPWLIEFNGVVLNISRFYPFVYFHGSHPQNRKTRQYHCSRQILFNVMVQQICEEALPIRSEHCQNTKFSKSRHWKWLWLADDDLPPSPEKNQQAKTHKTQIWPRKAERSQRLGNLPSYDRREVCTSHHHEQRRYRHRFNDHHLQHSSDWNSHAVRPLANIVRKRRKKKTGSPQKFLICATNGENLERKDWARRIWEIQGSKQQHQEVHEKGWRKLDMRTV